MELLFKQRMFSWFDSYDIYDENGNPVFEVRGKLAWGHKLEIYDMQGAHVGTIQERVLTFLPKFEMYIGGQYIGEIKKEFTFFKPVFTLDCNGWTVQGDLMGWDYDVVNHTGGFVMHASKQLFNWTDTYTIDVPNPNDVLVSLMIVLAIDAAKCSDNNN